MLKEGEDPGLKSEARAGFNPALIIFLAGGNSSPKKNGAEGSKVGITLA